MDSISSLKKRLHRGDADAFDELLDSVGDALYRYLLLRLKCSENAADVLQETFTRLVQFHRKLGAASNLKAYVFGCAKNELLRFHDRQKNRQQAPLHEEPEYEPVPELDSHDWVKSVLSHCADCDREIIQLKVFSKLTFDEIAVVIEMKPATVATRYRRAIKKLEGMIQGEGVKK